MGDPAWVKQRIAWETAHKIRTTDDKYGYGRAYINSPCGEPTLLTVLDPTAGGGSIPFEALRLGHRVIANELNPVAVTILYATLEYPARFGPSLADDIEQWGQQLHQEMVNELEDLFPPSPLDDTQKKALQKHLQHCPELIVDYTHEALDGFIYTHQVTCPHCGGQAPLLNTCWLSKELGAQWGVRIVPDGRSRDGIVMFETYRVVGGFDSDLRHLFFNRLEPA
jgi:putative DNA methylase